VNERTVKARTVTILMVDDDRVDAMAVRRSLEHLDITNPMIVAHNGIEALEYLRGENGREKVPRPYLILLDLNMPRMGGIEFLGELRRDPLLRHSLVVVMTDSVSEQDRVRAYDKNVAGYVVKHRAGERSLGSMSVLKNYCQIIEFPA
jgi:CheY-like chemotaxis protein